MSPHQAFAIADYQSGLLRSKEPFLLPRNAFQELTNGRVFRGRLEKRNGYTVFGVLQDGTGPVQQVATTVGAQSSTYGPFVYGPGVWAPMIPESAIFYSDMPSGTMTAQLATPIDYRDLSDDEEENRKTVVAFGTDTEIGFYDPVTGIFSISWFLHPGSPGEAPVDALGYVEYTAAVTDEPIMSLPGFSTGGSEYLLALTTRNIYKWDNTDFVMTDFEDSVPTRPDPFTGNERDYFWTWPLDSSMVIVNGVDPVYKFVPNASPELQLMPVDIDPDTPGVTFIDAAQMAIRVRGRLVYINVQEAGTLYPRRARWTVAGSFETFPTAAEGGSFADAPAEYGNAVTAGFVGERLFVGFQNGWMELFSTGDNVSPLQWRPIVSRYGSSAKLTTIPDSDRLLTRGNVSMQAVDPNGQRAFDQNIPDYVINLDPSRSDIAHSVRNDQQFSFWWAYCDQSAPTDRPNKILAAQYDADGNLSWSTLEMGFNAFGEFIQDSSKVWDDLPGVWDDYDNQRWDDAFTAESFPVTLGGTYDGVVYEFYGLSSDVGNSVKFNATTQALQPFGDEKSHFGWLDIYAEASEGVEATFTFYDLIGGSPYKSVTVDFTPEKDVKKVYRRIKVNRTSLLHQIRIEVDNTKNFALDAMIPYFRAAGRTKDFG